MLIGIDFLRRVDFTLSAEAHSPHGTLTLGSQLLSMIYTDTASLHISVLNVAKGSSQVKSAAVHLLRKTEVPPHSGCFLEARIARAGPTDGDVLVTPGMNNKLSIPHLVTRTNDRRCNVWAVNSTNSPVILGHGTRLGTVADIEELYVKDQQKEAAAGEDIIPIRPDLFGDQNEPSLYTAVGMSRPPTSVIHTHHGMAEVRASSVAAAGDKLNPLRPEPGADEDATHDKQGLCGTAVGMSQPLISIRPTTEANAPSVAAEDGQSPVRPKPWASLESEESDSEFLWDDYGMGLEEDEISYDDFDIEGAVLPPSVAVATCQAAEITTERGTVRPDLMHLEETEQREVLQIVDQYHMLFDGGEDAVGPIPSSKHQIDTGDAKPVCTRQWRLPHSARETIRGQCDKMLNTGVIEPSTSPWLSPVVLVKKKDGGVRFCVDYRALNAVTKGDSYPLPRIEELLDELGPMNIFTTLDARAAYWAVEVDPPDRPKTAFSDGYRLFQFVRLPFGLSTAPTTFQRTINVVLAAVLGKHTLCYLDDIIIYSRSFAQHLADLNETLGRLKAAELKLNLDKCTAALLL